MVGIIVDDDRAFHFADLREATLDTFKPFKCSNNCLIGNTKLERDRNRSQRILDIVAARDRHMHRDGASLTIAAEDQCIEITAARHRRHIVRANVGERREAIGHDPPVADSADDVLHLRMVDAQDR